MIDETPPMIGKDALTFMVVGPSPTQEELAKTNDLIARSNALGFRLRGVTAAPLESMGVPSVVVIPRYALEGQGGEGGE